jgi:flagellin-like hook-associated protein FlgL
VGADLTMLVAEEVRSMSVPPIRRLFLSDNADVLTGRGARSGGTNDAATRLNEPDSPSVTDRDAHLASEPALLETSSARAASALLRQAGEAAEHLSASLEQIAGARSALGDVQKLVEQLRDVAVVSLDRSLQPMDRVALQRQVDRALSAIDTLAESTRLDTRIRGLKAIGGTGADRDVDATAEPAFSAIGTETLGIDRLDVRSADDALGAMHALDQGVRRLSVTAASLDGATARVEGMLAQLTSPATTVSGEVAIQGTTAALSAAMLTSDQLRARPKDAMAAQEAPSAARVRRLLS